MEEDDVAKRSAGARFVEVGGHPAIACSGQDGVGFVSFAMRKEKAERAKQNSRQKLQKVAELHRAVFWARSGANRRALARGRTSPEGPARSAW